MSKKEIVDNMEDHDADNDGIDEEYDYIKVESKSSSKLTEIKGFIYGGFSSRVGMLRKHINSYARDQLDTLPFYSWECITLELEKRQVDLVIRNEAHMDMLLKFLISTLKTIDGRRKSAEPIINKIYKIKSKQLGYS